MNLSFLQGRLVGQLLRSEGNVASRAISIFLVQHFFFRFASTRVCLNVNLTNAKRLTVAGIPHNR